MEMERNPRVLPDQFHRLVVMLQSVSGAFEKASDGEQGRGLSIPRRSLYMS
jgi:hypothetical protein